MYDSGQAQSLARFKDGKSDGLETLWHENGQKRIEETCKDGKEDGGSVKFWNSKGEEVETWEESEK
jgi:antitoxin component YwqK of YwqJK toxin-antitoxin module